MSVIYSNIRCEVDELGSAAALEIDTSVYSQAAVLRASYWFTDKYFLFLHRGSDSQFIRVELRSKVESTESQLKTALREFCNSLLDYQVRQDVIVETGAVRDALIQRAFSEGRGHIDPNLILSDESKLPDSETHYEIDEVNIGHLTGEDDEHDKSS